MSFLTWQVMNILFNVAGLGRSLWTWQVMNVLSNFAFPERPPSGGLGFAARKWHKDHLQKIPPTTLLKKFPQPPTPLKKFPYVPESKN